MNYDSENGSDVYSILKNVFKQILEHQRQYTSEETGKLSWSLHFYATIFCSVEKLPFFRIPCFALIKFLLMLFIKYRKVAFLYMYVHCYLITCHFLWL